MTYKMQTQIYLVNCVKYGYTQITCVHGESEMIVSVKAILHIIYTNSTNIHSC